MATTSRGYELVPSGVAPDVPLWVNPTFTKINDDVAGVDARVLGLEGKALALNDDLNTLPPGKYYAATGSLAASLKNSGGAVNPLKLVIDKASTPNGVLFHDMVEYGTTGPIHRTRQSLSNNFQDWITDPVQPTRTIVAALGDSRTDGGGVGEPVWLASEKWTAAAQSALGGTASVVNYGRSGDTTDEVLIRMGIHSLWFAVTGGSIPASGAVAVTTRFNGYIPRDRVYTGSLAGILGTLAFTYSSKTWTFTRSTAGTATPVTGASPLPTHVLFTNNQTVVKQSAIVFWADRNDDDFLVTGLEGNSTDHSLANHRRVLDYMPAGDKRVLFLGPTLNLDEKVGTAGYNRVWDRIAKMKALFPGSFYSVQEYVLGPGLADAGITPTPADLAAISNKEMPPSAMIAGDKTHMNKAMANAYGRWIASLIAAKGWVN